MDRVAFTIFGIDVMWYGVLIATGMLIGIALAVREAKRVGISEDDVLNIAIIAIPVAIICARLYYVIFSWDYYSQIALAVREAKRVGISEDDVLNIAIIAIPVAIICARLYYVIFSWDYYSQNPGEIFNIRGGGLSWDYYSQNPGEIFNIRGGGLAIHGGLIGGILTGFIYAKVKKLDFFKTADAVMVGMPLAQAIGRWGNFINGEAHGGPTSLPWGIMVDGVKVHPRL